MSVAGPAQIGDVDRVRLKDTVRIGPHQKPVLVKVKRRSIVVVVNADLCCVARPDEILSVIIANEDVLVAILESVEIAVRILLELLEINQIELVSIRKLRAKEPYGAIGIAKDEPSKIADKRLRTGSN